MHLTGELAEDTPLFSSEDGFGRPHTPYRQLNSETDIKNVMTGWANKKPFGDITIPLEHRMKTIFVTT